MVSHETTTKGHRSRLLEAQALKTVYFPSLSQTASPGSPQLSPTSKVVMING
jgi:hypothetical protein